MNDECVYISDFIITYTNNTISEENNNILLNHLVICPECRKELASTLSLSESILEQSKDVPDDITSNVFSMIPQEDNIQTSYSLLDLKSSFEALKEALSTTKKSISFVLQFI